MLIKPTKMPNNLEKKASQRSKTINKKHRLQKQKEMGLLLLLLLDDLKKKSSLSREEKADGGFWLSREKAFKLFKTLPSYNPLFPRQLSGLRLWVRRWGWNRSQHGLISCIIVGAGKDRPHFTHFYPTVPKFGPDFAHFTWKSSIYPYAAAVTFYTLRPDRCRATRKQLPVPTY